MGFPYTWIKATEDATWVTNPPSGNHGSRGHAPSRFFVRVLVERAVWQVDRQPVEVVQGLVVGFNDIDQANYFLTAHDPRFEAPRCERVTVVPGMHVVFYEASDALLFTHAGKAEVSSEEEAVRDYTARLEASEAEDAGDDTPVASTAAEEKPTAKKRGKR